MEVFIVYHVHEVDEDSEDTKLIGVYSSEDRAREAVARLSRQVGFQDTPEGFQIEAYRLDEDHWTEGYVRVPDEVWLPREPEAGT